MATESVKELLRRAARRHGYSVYRSASLPVGFDLIADISRIRRLDSIAVVFDIGANVGDWTMQYLRHAPAATFFCFEPTGRTFDTLAHRMGSIARVRAIRQAVGAAKGLAPLYHHGKSVQHSLVAPAAAADGIETEEVEVVTVDDFAEINGIDHIDLLKTDTEGFDEQVLAGAGGMLARRQIDFVLAEVNFATGDARHSSFAGVTGYLGDRGYQPIGFYDVHLWGPRWFIMYMNVLYTCL
jgi:FkbM family methyltransferase